MLRASGKPSLNLNSQRASEALLWFCRKALRQGFISCCTGALQEKEPKLCCQGHVCLDLHIHTANSWITSSCSCCQWCTKSCVHPWSEFLIPAVQHSLKFPVAVYFRSEWRNNLCSRRRDALCNRRRQRWRVDANPKERRWGGLCPHVLCWSLFGQKCQRCYDLYLMLLLLFYLLSQR